MTLGFFRATEVRSAGKMSQSFLEQRRPREARGRVVVVLGGLSSS